MAKKKKTLAEKIQKEMDKLEALHEKEEAIMERMRDLVEDDDTDDLFDNEGSLVFNPALLTSIDIDPNFSIALENAFLISESRVTSN